MSPGHTILIRSRALVMQGFPGWADTGHSDRIELEFTGRDGLLPASIRQLLMTFAVFVFLVLELRISTAEPVVWHVAVDLPFVQVLHVGFVYERKPRLMC